MKQNTNAFIRNCALGAALLAGTAAAQALDITRLTPPSALFSFGDATPPIIARFLPDQRFDLQCTVLGDPGTTITSVTFAVDGTTVPGAAAIVPATALPAGSFVASLRAFSSSATGIHTFTATANQSDGHTVTKSGNFEVVALTGDGVLAKNIIIMIGDGMGASHRTAARIVSKGVSQGKALDPLAMDTFPVTGMVQTSSLNSIVTDSAPGAACYSSGNKCFNGQEGVFPDDTLDKFDNPRVELIGEYLARKQGKALGIVTTADVFDATPAAFAIHTQDRGAGTGICDQYLDEAVGNANLKVLMGGGRKWFLPQGTLGSARSASNDYQLPADIALGWNAPVGSIDPMRNLISDFQIAGFRYASNKTSLQAIPASADKILGLFAFSNMNIALDKIGGRRGTSTVTADYGFPDQPMLDEMTDKAIKALSKNFNGFVLMVEGASIDKQAHNMDTERWIVDTIEFDRAVGVAKAFAATQKNTLVLVTADHECAGVAIIGSSTVTNADLQARAASGGGAAQLRTGVVGTYDAAKFPAYTISPDGYPATMDVDYRMLIGYAANADRYEDWLTNPLPLRDSQQPTSGTPYGAIVGGLPALPVNRDTTGNFLVTGQIADTTAAHTAGDIPLSAFGRGAGLFTGYMDNTDVFFKIMQSATKGRSLRLSEY